MDRALPNRVLGQLLAFGLLIPGMAGLSAKADTMEDGIAIVTTIHGKVSLDAASGTPTHPKLHQRMRLSKLRVETGTSGYLGLSLSNNTGLFLGPDTRLEVVRFRQQPFKPERESRDYEPSRSRIEISLDAGRIAVAAPGLSPLSTLEVVTAAGTASVRAATGLIRSKGDATSIASSKGNFVFVRADTAARSFVSANQGIRFRRLEGAAQLTETRFEAEDFSAPFSDLVGAAENARSRTLFRVLSDGAAIPVPFLVAKKAGDRPPSPRPYRFSN